MDNSDDTTMKTWQFQHAANHLDEVIRCVLHEGPHAITMHGSPSVVVISLEEYSALIKIRKKNEPLSVFFHTSPFQDVEIEFARSQDFGRSEVIL